MAPLGPTRCRATLPGFIKTLMTKSWVERYMRQQMEDFKALAEATVPAPA
jgi:hypothetical protein